MAQNNTANDAQTQTISDAAIEAVADDHHLDADALAEAVADSLDEWACVADEMYAKYVEHDEEYTTDSLIYEDDDSAIFYVRCVEWDPTVDELIDSGHDEDIAGAVPWVHNEEARHCGADSNVLGTMDALAVRKSDL